MHVTMNYLSKFTEDVLLLKDICKHVPFALIINLFYNRILLEKTVYRVFPLYRSRLIMT